VVRDGRLGDYNNDGFVDLFVPNTTASFGASINFLYRNNGDGTFTHQSADQAGPIASDKDASAFGYWGDVNNDGFLDLLVPSGIASANSRPVSSRLYVNRGSGAFRSADGGDLTKPYYYWGGGGLADYDNDGNLDAFICAAWADSGHMTNLLFHGRGDGTFSLLTSSVVATDQSENSNDAAWGDFNNDGLPDLIVANNSVQDFFYRNDGHGQFTRMTDSILEAGFKTAHHAWGDYDNDGFLDVAQGTADGTRLFRNTGTGDFVEATNLSAPVGYRFG